MRVGIIGAGIGGLATAVGLQRAGVPVTVFERRDGAGDAGSGISLFGNGLAALDALGLGPAAREIGAVPGGIGPDTPAGQRRPDGRWLTRLPHSVQQTVAVVHRADLQRILLDALAPGTVHTGRPAQSVSVDGRTVDLAGGPETFDVVVAADGIGSRVRRDWPGDPGIRSAGYRAWRGVSAQPVDVTAGIGETVGRGLRFGIAPLADGRVYWFAVISEPAGQPAGQPTLDGPGPVLAAFGGWHRPIRDIVAATPPEAIRSLPIEQLAGRLPTYRRGRCVLLGDAAHAMTPNLGQGGNQALEDAATLVALLTDPTIDGRDGRIDAAVAEYDRRRRPRTQRIARQAALLGRVLQARGPLTAWARDAALRFTPPAVAARGARAVQRGRPPAG
jgi:2-polyprenyl-6-methoxyphenol hydroxylase-like FAD-dependent oxidoreductase